MGAVAQWQKSVDVAKLRAARVRMRRNTGRCEGRKAFGARPGEPAILDRAKRLRASGATFATIAAQLNRLGLQNRLGNPWSPAAVLSSPEARGVTPARLCMRHTPIAIPLLKGQCLSGQGVRPIMRGETSRAAYGPGTIVCFGVDSCVDGRSTSGATRESTRKCEYLDINRIGISHNRVRVVAMCGWVWYHFTRPSAANPCGGA
jgi:hypothetical protein